METACDNKPGGGGTPTYMPYEGNNVPRWGVCFSSILLPGIGYKSVGFDPIGYQVAISVSVYHTLLEESEIILRLRHNSFHNTHVFKT